jgi:hypothetical protein
MKNDNKILFALLEQLLSKSEDGECDEVDKFGDSKEPNVKELDIEDSTDDGENEDDEDSKKIKKFLESYKG